MFNEKTTLSDLRLLGAIDPKIDSMLMLLLAPTPEDFTAAIRAYLDEWAEIVESDPNVRQEDSEDRLTQELIMYMNAKGLEATHDSFEGGHCDIVIKRSKYKWLGEAKIFSGAYTHIQDGFEQLCSRYSSGASDPKEGGLLIYIKSGTAAHVIKRWREEFESKSIRTLKLDECPKRQFLSFYSTHNHDRSGIPYKVRHFGVILTFNPTDKSGKAVAKKANKPKTIKDNS